MGLVRRGLVGLGLVTVARRISSVVGLTVGGVVLRLGVSVRVLDGILVGLAVTVLIGLVRVGLVVLGGVLVVGVLGVLVAVVVCGVVFLVGLVRRGLVGLGLVTVARRISSVVGLAVGRVVLRLRVSVRVLRGIMPMLSVGIGLTGATCVAGAVASLAGVGGLIRVGGGHVCRSLSTIRLFVAAAQEFFEGWLLLGCGGGVGCAGGGCTMRASTGRGCTGGRSAGRGSSVGASRRSTSRGCVGCAVGSAASSVGGAAGIRIHERVVVRAVRRAGCSVCGSCMAAGASIACCGRMRRRGGLGCTGHTVGAVSRISGRKSRIRDIRTTVRGVAGVACGIGGVAASVCGVAGASGTVCGMVCAAGDTSTSGSCVCGVAGVAGGIGCPSGCVHGAAGVPDSSASPRGAAGVSGPVQGASHAVGGVSGVVGVVGGFSRALCGVCQIREVRGRVHTAGGELADQVLAELGQGADVVGADGQDSLEDLFTDAQSASGAGQGLLAGRHAGAATHRRNCEDHVGQEVTNGAPGIVGPRIPVDQRLADSRHKAHGILP